MTLPAGIKIASSNPVVSYPNLQTKLSNSASSIFKTAIIVLPFFSPY